jgi:phosphomannomutase
MPPRLVAYDLDGTLARSKSTIEPVMAGLILGHLDVADMCIITGGDMSQIRTQVVDPIDGTSTQLQRLHLMPTCGTSCHRYLDGSWQEIYAEKLKPTQIRATLAVLEEGARHYGLWEEKNTAGDILEVRGDCQVTFSALGQLALPEDKEVWDPDGTKKELIRSYAAERLPDLEVRSGGSTSVDVTQKGVDKAYGMNKLMEQSGLGPGDMLFVGDRLDPKGNDAPVARTGIDTIAVRGPQDTARVIAMIIDFAVK